MNQLLNQYPQEIQAILAKYPDGSKRAAVMPLLHLAQRESGCITKLSMQEIGEILGMSITDVDSIVGFYTLFHEKEEANAGGRYYVQVCTDLPCALRGADEFLRQVCDRIGLKVGESTPDGKVTIEEVTCLAGCHRAPLFQVQGDGDIQYHENQTVDSAVELIDELRKRGEAA
ncbi:NADH dehydrogenase subunit E [Longilinea arvoryzae]|uniref:NADH dehydrogenase subunit E n=1 Tax=Longilinea arvoryzae TaxID=360412 RepID=A0A0S7BPL6_9CHLR|nr:NAD(P)H-dependent oxidoreductase subunit E [Longilinea arvoryzae]GAP15905.1 NADH dehydrogenase subunit E [Longilinea arvoryzae]